MITVMNIACSCKSSERTSAYNPCVAWILVCGMTLGMVRVHSLASEAPLTPAALQLQETSGAKRGVCVHLGSGSQVNPGLSAELASGDMHVHGLAIDDKALEAARNAIIKRDVSGLAVVGKITKGPLPYVPDIANLVVIEDWDRLAAQGLTMTEVERVTAPGGAICIWKNGSWQKTVKARPAGMGDWTHTQGGADRAWVSRDSVVKLPLGLRWQDGLPNSINQRSDCRGWVVADGRCFVLHLNELENVLPFPDSRKNPAVEYLAAHDAFNGTLIWKVPLAKRAWFTESLNAYNGAPLVTDGKRVFVAIEGEVLGFDSLTGKKFSSSPVTYPTTHLSLAGGVLVAAGWDKHVQNGWWTHWTPAADKGVVEAFSAADGKLKWKFNEPVVQMLIDDGTVVALTQCATPATQQSVVALDLASGAVRWRVPHSQLSTSPDLHLAGMGAGTVAVDSPAENLIIVLGLMDGKKRWDMPIKKIKDNAAVKIKAFSTWCPVVEGKLWYSDKIYDPLTGVVTGKTPINISSVGCTPVTIAPNVIAVSRSAVYQQIESGRKTAEQKFSQRGQCIEGATFANGMLYSGQNLCHCAVGQVPGFVGFGWNGELPAGKDFAQPRPVEHGPAAGSAKPAPATAGDWPGLMHDASRSSSTAARPPKALKQIWASAPLVADRAGAIPEAWRNRMGQSITAPVVAGSKIVVAVIDRGEVVALDLAKGTQLWRKLGGARIDSAPTLADGLCVFGAHDGWITALSAADGRMAWRVRAAPREQLMMSFGQMESAWPVYGSVVVMDACVYATMGRSSCSDGGLGALAVKLADGSPVWAHAIPSATAFQNDLLAERDGELALFHMIINPATGVARQASRGSKHVGLNGMVDPSWTRLGPMFAGRSRYGRVLGELLAWNDKDLVVYDATKSKRNLCCALPVEKARTLEDKYPKKLAPTANPANAEPVMIQNLPKEDCRWVIPMPVNQQAEAMALCGDVLVLAGRTWDAATQKLGGFLWTVSMADGKKINESTLKAPPIYQGIAMVNDRIVLTLQDGCVVCFGE